MPPASTSGIPARRSRISSTSAGRHTEASAPRSELNVAQGTITFLPILNLFAQHLQGHACANERRFRVRSGLYRCLMSRIVSLLALLLAGISLAKTTLLIFSASACRNGCWWVTSSLPQRLFVFFERCLSGQSRCMGHRSPGTKCRSQCGSYVFVCFCRLSPVRNGTYYFIALRLHRCAVEPWQQLCRLSALMEPLFPSVNTLRDLAQRERSSGNVRRGHTLF
mmetsp:Transcript_99365/g.318862  ORF Transcript_99365/g.318862 Transcript_99365/m.318862 type:complete len:223 (+) Transcript_99365:1653-2321(+)